MRKLLIGLAIVVLVLAAALVVAVLSLNRIIAANRDVIVARLQEAVGRPVQVKDVVVRFGTGLGIGLTQIQIGDDPAFGREPFLRADELTARLKLWPLLERRLEVRRVSLTAPTLRIVRNATGKWNYESLGPHASQARRQEGIVPVAGPAASAAPVPPFAFLVQSVKVADGTAVFVDRARSPESVTKVQKIDLEFRDVSQDRPIGFDLKAAVEGDRDNVRLTGLVGPLAQRARLPLKVQGSFGPFASLNAAVDGMDLRAFMTPDSIELEQLSGNALSGTFGLAGAYALGSGGPVRLAGELRGISLQQLVSVRGHASAYAIEGNGSLRLDLRGTTGGDLLRSMAGTMAVDVAGGAIRDFNLVNELLTRVSGLPALTRMIADRIKPKYGHIFNSNETRFDKVQASFRVSNGRADTDDMTIVAEDFGVRAAGWFDLDRNVDMTGTLRMSKRFSDDVAADVKEARYLFDDGQLAIPFELRGKLGEAKPKPDTAHLTRLLERAAAGSAGQLLDKLFGGKRGAESTPGAKQPSNSLQRGLRELFGR